MTRSTTVYDNGLPVTIGQLLNDMRRAPASSLLASFYANQIRGAMILTNDFPEDICQEIDQILKEKGEAPLTVGSPNNLQAGLTLPAQLVNYIFVGKVDLRRMWEWIRDHFLPLHQHGYDWFALLRFLADRQQLEKGVLTSNTDFARQMHEWFPSYGCTANGVKLYRTGYLGATPYQQWQKAEFSRQKRKGQTIDGYNHLDRLLTTDLTLAAESDPLPSSYQ